jgi:DNA helicase-2/ATP-dependent DNA helicase PcrA
VINTPRRGIGKTTIDGLVKAAQELNQPLWEVITDETLVKTVGGRAAKNVLGFTQVIQRWRDQLETLPANEIVQGVLDDSGYVDDLKAQSTDEAEERLQNVGELYNAVLQFQEESEEDQSLSGFLASASLASDLDNLEEGDHRVSLMTLHSSKGLEFPVVFLVGLEQGLFPNFRSLEDPAALEEERRLCYVGITRAQDRLFISYARERRLYGNREPASPSLFLAELPKDLLEGNAASAIPTKWTQPTSQFQRRNLTESVNRPGTHENDWSVGDRVMHPAYGTGQITNIFGKGDKICFAAVFPTLGKKIVDPKVSPVQRVD